MPMDRVSPRADALHARTFMSLDRNMLFIEARQLSCQFPHRDSPLFSDIDIALGTGTHYRVGRNGSGKSLLAAILAGHRAPDSGTVLHAVPPGYLPQTPKASDGTVAALLGVEDALKAHQRIMDGNGTEADYELLDDRWSLPAEVEQRLDEGELPRRLLWQHCANVSGGERTRLAILALRLAGHPFLILDEPTNHLDRAGRAWFGRWLDTVPGALIVSHDRGLLRKGETIYELDSLGLQQHRGGWDDYLSSREQLRLGAQRDEQHALTRLQQTRKAQRTQTQAGEAKRANAHKQRADANQSKLILDRRKETSDQTQSRLAKMHGERESQSLDALREARQRLEQVDPLTFTVAEPTPAHGHTVWLHDVVLPYGRTSPLSLSLQPDQRVAVIGPNGSGKSTLMRVLTGEERPLSGDVRVAPHIGLLDQQCGLLDPTRNALENFAALAPGWTEDRYRTTLAQLRLRNEMALIPVCALSGGERIKVALAALFCGPRSPSLLLLDEPDNHLDLESKQLLESALARYRGSLLVVSHDDTFVANAGIDRVLYLTGD
jgi:ATPase subunit of ABC transporter with duplicated ATPase domains